MSRFFSGWRGVGLAGAGMLGIGAASGWTMLRDGLVRAALTPAARFRADTASEAPDYAAASAWLSRPDLAGDPSRWTPQGATAARRPQAAVFYVAPTAFFSRSRWNAPLHDLDAEARLRLFAAGQASAFNGAAAIWAPRYRQATIGAFLGDSADAAGAIDLAYGDVAAAFDAFVRQLPASRPIILAGHSQGSLHLMRLLAERVAGRPLAARIVAAYLAGWPVSLEADLPALGLPACATADQTGCILSWQSFAEVAGGFGTGTDVAQVRDRFAATAGLAGIPRRGTRILCTNPITGTPSSAAPASANLGALRPTPAMDDARLVPGLVPARCDESGFLLIGPPPKGFGRYVLPGQNYHVFDYALFWANIRADAERRLAAFARR